MSLVINIQKNVLGRFFKSKNKFNDNFRVRVVKTHDGTLHFYPEYSYGILGSRKHIILINNKVFKLSTMFDTLDFALDSMEQANEYIEGFKNQLASGRAKTVIEEDIKSVE